MEPADLVRQDLERSVGLVTTVAELTALVDEWESTRPHVICAPDVYERVAAVLDEQYPGTKHSASPYVPEGQCIIVKMPRQIVAPEFNWSPEEEP